MGALAWLESFPLPLLTCVPDEASGTAGIRYDGLVTRTPEDGTLGAVDLLAGPEGRAAHLRDAVPPGGALARATAVWVHTGRLRPDRTDVVVQPHLRVHAPLVVVHRQYLAPDDVVEVAGVLTTTPLRTAVDLLCFGDRSAAVTGVRALLRQGLPLAEVQDAVRRPDRRLPVRRAQRLLAEVTEPVSSGRHG